MLQKGKGTTRGVTPTVHAPPLPDVSGTYFSRREQDDGLLQLPPDYSQATTPDR
jgi:hypothetical protein